MPKLRAETKRLMTPPSGLYISDHTTATTAMVVATGMKYTVRKMREPFSGLFTITASSSAKADCSGATTATNRKLFFSAAQKESSSNSRR